MSGLFEPTHLILIAAAALLLFGPKRLPGVGRQVGKWLGEFRQATSGLGEELKAGLNEPSSTSTPAAAKATEPKALEAPAPAPGPRDTV